MKIKREKDLHGVNNHLYEYSISNRIFRRCQEFFQCPFKDYRNTNHFHRYFNDDKLNIFKAWEGIREIINISIKGSNSINYIQIGKKKSPTHLR